MSYLIDGNNVMGQRVGWHRDRVRARRELLDELARFASRRKARLSVVFDGAPDEHFADGSSYRGVVRVFYAARGSDADERIKSLVEDSRERRTMVVVTSDRALAEYVRRCGAQVVRAGEFRRRMEEANAESAAENTDAPPVEESTERWMRYFGVAPEDDE